MNTALKQFFKNTVSYLSKLSKNNNREWFEKNRERFNSDFLEPAVQFVADMGEKLLSIDSEIVAIPKIDKSIFRLHRDVRFSKNKDPYKTNMGLLFWNSRRKKMESSGFYFHLEPNYFFIGTGTYVFTKELLKKYRDVVSDPAKGKELDMIIKKLLKKKDFKLGGKNYKKVPRGYDPESRYSGYMLHDGIYVYVESKDLNNLKNPVEYTFKLFREMLPLHQWLVKYMN